MASILILLLLLLTGLTFSILVYLKARKNDNALSQSHAILSGSMILGFGIMLIAYFIYKGNGWSEDNRVAFYQTGTLSVSLGFIIFGGHLLLSGKKQKSLLTMISGAAWLIGVIVVGYFSYTLAGKLNQGWSPEKKAKVRAKCDPSTTNCECFLLKTMEYFKSVDDYNKTLSNESKYKDRVDTYFAIIDTACSCGQINSKVEEVELPF
jgi:vacuolar-type H+-ATPase subunit I/STV1